MLYPVEIMRRFPFIQTSVFADSRYAFSGNQLATLWDFDQNNSLSRDEMQGITREMNFSETTFAFAPTLDGCSSKVRIFTPGREIPFAGHPTLGTAYVLRLKGIIPPSEMDSALELGVGKIPVKFLDDARIQMTQPKPEFLKTFDGSASLAEAIGIDTDEIADTSPMQFVSTGFPFLIVRLQSIDSVQRAAPNPVLIQETLEGMTSQQILIFSTETIHGDSDIHARMFAPSVGVLEDPATGSAAGPLGAYLAKYEIIRTKTDNWNIVVEQGYQINRPSRLMVEVSKGIEEVLVAGDVRLTAESTFILP
ncbi:MAG: PhzF family phenazine biosynthesis protein [Candidatus Thorarchaeota archaeon]